MADFQLRDEQTGSSASSQKIFLQKNFLNACVRNVFVLTQSCDSCRIDGHLPHDRALIAHEAT